MLLDYSDMLSQSHVLIAGATGSGKSVAVNGMIYNAIDNPASMVQLILIDPKRVELYRYHAIPHVLQYASEPTEIIAALNYAIQLIDSRSQYMRANRLLQYDGSHVYVIVDELADIMTTIKKQVQPLLQRISQLGRAYNIHLIACTQCPLTQVIPTPIKVNLTSVLGLHTRSRQDSRNIIGRNGLEELPRFGRGYWLTPEHDLLVDIPLISQTEIQSRIDSIAGSTHTGSTHTGSTHTGSTHTGSTHTGSTLPPKKWYEFWRV